MTNDIYGGFSRKFKIHFVVTGMLNFSQHYNDKHSECERFVWYGKCSAGCDFCSPHHCYIQYVVTECGQRCNGMVPHFFELLVTGFVVDAAPEKGAWPAILNTHTTTVFESYNHSLAFYISKHVHTPANLAVLKEAANFLNFTEKQKSGVDQKGKVKLVSYKHSGLVDVARSAYNSRRKPPVIRAIARLVSDSNTQA